MKYLFITVNYKQSDYVLQFLDSIRTTIYSADDLAQLVVVDNSSDFDVPLGLDIVRLDPGGNVGYLKGLKFGLANSDIGSFDYVILCNPDISLDADFFQSLKSLGNILGGHDLLAPSILSDGVNQNPNLVSKPTTNRIRLYDLLFSSLLVFSTYTILSDFRGKIRRIFSSVIASRREHSDAKSHDILEIFLPHGSFLIFKSDFFRQDKIFDADVFLWGEEAIIAHQVREAGGKVVFCPSIVVHHISHSATSSISLRKKFEIWKRSYGVYREFLL